MKSKDFQSGDETSDAEGAGLGGSGAGAGLGLGGAFSSLGAANHGSSLSVGAVDDYASVLSYQVQVMSKTSGVL